MADWKTNYHNPIHVPEAHRIPPPDASWFATQHTPSSFGPGGVVQNALTPAQIQETLRPFKLLKRPGEAGADGWETRIYERVDTKLRQWHQTCHKFSPDDKAFANYATWEIDSVRLIYNEARSDTFASVPCEPGCREPFLAFHGTQLAHFRSIIKDGFSVSSPNGWYGNGGYFTPSLPYAQHYIGGMDRFANLHDTEHGMMLPKRGHVVYIFGVMVKPGKTQIIGPDTSAPGATYKGEYRNKPGPKDGCHSHMAFVSPQNKQNPKNGNGFRPVQDRSDAFAEEIVIFDKNRVLPRFIIGLKRTN